MEYFRIDYKKKESTLIGSSVLITKKNISDNGWKIMPIFDTKDTMAVQGVTIYHLNKKWDELIRCENYQKMDYICLTEIGSCGYSDNGDQLHLKCMLNPDLAYKEHLSYGEERDINDRLLNALSNMAPNTSYLSPNDHFKKQIKN
jgi:hypothetical protein